MSNPSELVLQVGKTYRVRRGFDRITITRKRDDGRYPFIGDNGRSYAVNGYQVFNGVEWIPMYNDLVKEVRIG